MRERRRLSVGALVVVAAVVLMTGCGEDEKCSADAECDDGIACNGLESCVAGECVPGEPVDCGTGMECKEPAGECGCARGWRNDSGLCVPDHCEVPRAPVLSVIHNGAVLRFTTCCGYPVEIAWSAGDGSSNDWTEGKELKMNFSTLPMDVTVRARMKSAACTDEFDWTYTVTEHYPGPAGSEDSTAIPADDPSIVAWATGWVEPVEYGDDVDDQWRTPERAVGPADSTSEGVVSLGRGGAIVMTFERPIVDGPGPDFAVFENALNDEFLELGRVGVSSDGQVFAWFDFASLTGEPVDAFGTVDTRLVGQLAGKYRMGFGTPFDLASLSYALEVLAGEVSLRQVRFVKIEDIPGDGSVADSFGMPVYDPYPTRQSAGFDLDAIGVLNQAQ